MSWPFVSRRRYEAELAAINADRERIRGERTQFAKDRDAFKYAAESASEKFVDVSIVNARLTEDLVDLRAKLAASVRAESGLARQIQAMSEPVEPSDAYMDDLTRLTRERDAEKKRADEAEARLSTASPAEVDAWERRVKAHDAWTPSADPDKRPMEGGSGRPIHPATELRQALERCRALQARLDGRGKPVTS